MAKNKPIVKTRKVHPSLRPPVVVVLGHVDHGKTTLLDAIRKTNLVSQEHGGITQHIGAYQIKVKTAKAKGKSNINTITFIDTPGHEAFAKMRRRGAQVADLAVLVVAANDGVKPQTLEALNHIKQANIPFIVAINKIDLPNINLKRVERDLAANKILVEDMGGKIPAVPISAKNKTGLDELLEMIILVAELEELKNEPGKSLQAVVIEAKLSPTQGPLATLVIKRGTIKVNQEITLDKTTSRIRAIIDDKGHFLNQAGPGQAVEILGLKQLPAVGTRLPSISQTTLPNKSPTIKKTASQEFNTIIKADNLGTLEALMSNLPPSINIVQTGIGPINESDVFLAAASQSTILGLHVKVAKPIVKLAEREGVLIKTYQVIYQLLAEINDLILALKQSRQEKILGRARIIAEFPYNKMLVAGCRVTKGRLCPKDHVRLEREKETIAKSKIESLRQGKESISKAEEGSECGVLLIPQLDFQLNDMLISYHKPK